MQIKTTGRPYPPNATKLLIHDALTTNVWAINLATQERDRQPWDPLPLHTRTTHGKPRYPTYGYWVVVDTECMWDGYFPCQTVSVNSHRGDPRNGFGLGGLYGSGWNNRTYDTWWWRFFFFKEEARLRGEESRKCRLMKHNKLRLKPRTGGRFFRFTINR